MSNMLVITRQEIKDLDTKESQMSVAISSSYHEVFTPLYAVQKDKVTGCHATATLSHQFTLPSNPKELFQAIYAMVVCDFQDVFNDEELSNMFPPKDEFVHLYGSVMIMHKSFTVSEVAGWIDEIMSKLTLTVYKI